MYVQSSGTFIAYANGDNSNCGGISIGKTTLGRRTVTDTHEITINNMGDNLGACAARHTACWRASMINPRGVVHFPRFG